MVKRDNCKNCVSRCEHAGKDREFIYSGEKSCKVLYTPERVTKAAADFVGAIKLIATKPDNLDNLESYLSHHSRNGSADGQIARKTSPQR